MAKSKLLSYFVLFFLIGSLSFALTEIKPADAAAVTITSVKYTGDNEVTIVFSGPVDWTIGDFTNLIHDFTSPSNPSIVLIAETAPSSTVTITFGGTAVFPDETGAIDIAAISDGGSGNTFAGSSSQTVSDGIAPTWSSVVTSSIVLTPDEGIAGDFLTTDFTLSDGFTVTGISPSGGQAGPIFSVTLTTSPSLTADDTPTVTYTQGNLVDTSSNPLATNSTVAADGIAPTLTESLVFFADSISFFVDETIVDLSPTAGDFTVSGVASTPSVVATTFGTDAVTLSLDSSITTSDTAITLSYTKTSGSITDSSGNTLANFASFPVTNAEPQISGVHTVNTTRIDVFFNTDLADASVASTDFTVAGNTVIGAPELSGTVNLILGTPIGTGDTPLVSLVSTVTDVIGFTNSSAANITPTDFISPVFSNASTFSTSRIDAQFSENMSVTGVTPTDFAILGTIANGATEVSSLAVSGDTIQLSLNNTLTDADTITLNYTGSGTSPTDTATAANPLIDFSAPESVSNTLDTTAPTLTSVSIESDRSVNDEDAIPGDTVTITFTADETIQTPTVTIDGNAADSVTNTTGNTWTATRTMQTGDTEGFVTFNIAFSDTASNAGTAVTSTTDSSSVTFDETKPTATAAETDTAFSISINTSEPVVNGAAEPTDFTITGIASSPTVTSVSTGSIILNFDNPITSADVSPITVNYVKTIGAITDFAGNIMDDFAFSPVTNDLVSGPEFREIIAGGGTGAIGYSVGDTITVIFSEATNEPFKGTDNVVTNTELLDLFTFSQSLGTTTSSWINPSTLVINVTDTSGSTPPAIGTLTATVKESGGLRNEGLTSGNSTSLSPELTGSFGTFTVQAEVAANGTTTTSVPDGKQVQVTIPEEDTITITEDTANIFVEDFTLMGDVLDVTATGGVCATGDTCQVSFTFNQDDLDQFEIEIDEVTILLDGDDDGDFQDGEEVDTTVSGTAPGPFIATSDENFGSKFAIGGIKALALLGAGGGDITSPKVNDVSFSFGESTSELDESSELLQLIEVGELIDLTFPVRENQGLNDIEHITLYVDTKYPQLDQDFKTNHIRWEKNKDVSINNPDGIIQDASIEITPINAINVEINFELSLAKELEDVHLMFVIWDLSKNSAQLYYPSAIQTIPIASDIIEPEIIEEPVEPVKEYDVPAWIKHNAKLWHEDTISDTEFTQAIEFLIRENVIEVPEIAVEDTEEKIQEVPSWIKNVAGLWSGGQVSDNEFAMTIEWLIVNSIIII